MLWYSFHDFAHDIRDIHGIAHVHVHVHVHVKPLVYYDNTIGPMINYTVALEMSHPGLLVHLLGELGLMLLPSSLS